MEFYVIPNLSNIGFITPGVLNDGGGYRVINGKIIPVPPWDGQILRDIAAGVNILKSATQISDSVARNAAIIAATEIIGKQLGGSVGEEGVVVVV
jgi:hypothetical protein